MGSNNSSKGRILTGHRPTGPRHIGHLFGTLDTWASLQDTYECFFLIADFHVLTTDYEHPQRIRVNITEVLIDWLAAGIDPDRATIILQSAIPEHAQLEVLLSMLTTVSRLGRVPTYKEQQQALHLKPSLGLLAYPVLQAADILIYKADSVPVGEDQLPHLELARELTRRFNQLYGSTFTEPQAILSQVSRLPGTDNRVMHTSYGNAIFLKDTPEDTTKKVMNMFTDPTRIHPTDPGHIENNPLFAYLDIFESDGLLLETYKNRYKEGRIGDIEIKRHLAIIMNEKLSGLRSRRRYWENRLSDINDILRMGTENARPFAVATFQEVKNKMGLNYL